MSSPHQPSAAPRPRRAVVLAAGEGDRLRPLTDRVPKPLLPLGSSSILEQDIAWLSSAGVAHAAINLHHRGDAIRAVIGDGTAFGLDVLYSEEPELLGTAGGTRKAASLLPKSWPLLVVYGDNLIRLDLGRLCEQHAKTRAVATIAVHWVPDVRDSGAVRFSETGRIDEFTEKPKHLKSQPGWVNAGIYLLEEPVLMAIPSAGPSDFGYDIFQQLLAQGHSLFAYCLAEDEGVYPIDTHDRYRQAMARLNRESELPDR